MMYNLLRASEDYADDLNKYGIIVKVPQRLVGYGDSVQILDPSYSKDKCKQILRQLINTAKEERAAKLQARQGVLL